MRLSVLILKEILHRKANFGLSALAVIATVAFFVGFYSTSEASRRETRVVTRDMGFNLRIIPRDTDMLSFWNNGFSDLTMSQDTVKKLASYENVFLSYNHLVATLQRRIDLQGEQVIFTGVAPTIAAQGKKPMGFTIEPGTVELGFQVAKRLGLKKNDTWAFGGRAFRVKRTLVESGEDDDIRIYGDLADVQEVLGLQGQINEIKAIDCLCLTSDQDPLTQLREELKKALPEATVLQMRDMADARARQRQMVDSIFGVGTPFLLVICAAWIAILATLNVRERKQEIGILRALGYGAKRIAALFLFKAMLIGTLGAVVGFVVGGALALHFGPDIFQVTGKSIRWDWSLLGWSVVGAPLFAAIASFVPAMRAVAQDPAVTLRDD